MTSKKMKIVAIAMILIVCIGLSVATVYSYLSDRNGSVTNNMSPEQDPGIHIEESFTTNSDNNLVKENVCVNIGDPGYAVYVRMLIVVNWQDDDGNVYSVAPVFGTDYTWTFDDDYDTNWFKKDSFYYLKSSLVSGMTPILIKSCNQLEPPPVPGYTLHVEVIAQTIQAVGGTDSDNTPAVTDAWGVYVVDEKLSATPPASP